MDTSKLTKQSQYNPGTVTRIGPGLFEADSRDGTHKHQIRRNGDKFFCNCPATSLCHHIIDLVVDSANKRGFIPSLWTSEADMLRQKKRNVRYIAGSKPFWVTFKKKADSVAKLDDQINKVSGAIVQARHDKLMTNNANRRAAAQAEMDAAYEKLNALQKERARAVVKRMAAKRKAA